MAAAAPPLPNPRSAPRPLRWRKGAYWPANRWFASRPLRPARGGALKLQLHVLLQFAARQSPSPLAGEGFKAAVTRIASTLRAPKPLSPRGRGLQSCSCTYCFNSPRTKAPLPSREMGFKAAVTRIAPTRRAPKPLSPRGRGVGERGRRTTSISKPRKKAANGRLFHSTLTTSTQAALACSRRGPSTSARPTISTSRSSSSSSMLKCGVKRSEFSPPWITLTPCMRSHSSVEPAP